MPHPALLTTPHLALILASTVALGCAVDPSIDASDTDDLETTSTSTGSSAGTSIDIVTTDEPGESTSGGESASASASDSTWGSTGEDGETGETSIGTSTGDPEDTVGTTDGPHKAAYDAIECPTSEAVELIVPGAAELVAFDKVNLTWRTSAEVASVQAWLSTNHGATYPHFLMEVAVDGEELHLEPWDSTVAKIKIAEIKGKAAATGYRIALAAYDAEGTVVGCSEGAKSFEIRGWPQDDFETVGELKFPDAVLRAKIDAETDPEDEVFGVTKLSLQNLGVADLTGIAHLTRLEDLHVYEEQVVDIAEVSWMSRLEILYLGTALLSKGDFDRLAPLTELRILSFMEDSITAAQAGMIPTFPNLTTFVIQYADLHGTIAPLPSFPKIDTIALTFSHVDDVSILPPSGTLKALWLDFNDIESLFGMHKYPSLQALYLGHNRIYSPAGIQSYEKLQELSLDANLMTNLSGLQAFPELTKLWLGSNELTSLDQLPVYPKLELIHLGDNHISNVSRLAQLPNLREIYLSQNNIKTGVKALASLSKVETLSLSNNPNIPCADQEYVRTKLLAKDPMTKVYLSEECK